MIIRPRLRNLGRLREIVGVFTKYGFSHIFRRIHIAEQVATWLGRKDISQNPPEVNLRLALEELGTTFIKIGQILSTRIDVLPESFCRELRKLQDEAPPVSFDQIKLIIEKELKKPLAEVFEEVDPLPLASASIAQVHQGILKGGQKVAIKVQKPGVEERVISDLEILTYLAHLTDRLRPGQQGVPLSEIVAEFQKHLMREIDFIFEAINARKFRENFKGVEGVYFPKIIGKHTTRRLLIMELIEGLPLSRLTPEKMENLDGSELARRGVEAVFKMIFEDGFFHADPHPGNVMIRQENAELVFLDFGMVGAVDYETRRNMVRLLFSALQKDAARMVDILTEEFLITPVEFPQSLRVDLNEILERYISSSLQELNLKDMISDFFYLLRKHKLRVPAHLSSLLRALVVAEGTGMVLDPHFTVAPHLEKFLRKSMTGFFGFKTTSRDLVNYILDWKKLSEEFPDKSHEALNQLTGGKLGIRIKIQEMENLNRRLESASARLSLSILLGCLLIGSSLMYTNFPNIRFISILGILGLTFSAILGVFLAIEMFRHR